MVAGTGPSLLTMATRSGEVAPIAWSPKARLFVITLSTGVLEPLRLIVRGEPIVSSVTVRVAVDATSARGLNFTVIVHDPPGASGVVPSPTQVFVDAKSAASAPPSSMLLTVTSPEPVFVYLTVFAAGAGDDGTFPKSTSF